MIDKIDYKITQESHPLLYFNWLKLQPSKRFKLYLKLTAVNQRLEKSTQQSNVKLTIMSNCIVGSIGGKTLGKALKMMPNLIEFDLTIQKGNQLGDLGIEGIVKGLIKQQQLKKLKLCICRNNSINNEGLKLFSKHLETLTQLEYFRFQLYNNNVDSQSCLSLYSSLAKIDSLKTLKLYLVNVRMNVDEMEFVGEYIKQLKNLTNLHLLLNYEEDIESKALLFLSLGLSTLSNLQRLSLNFITPSFGENAVQYLFNKSIAKLSLLRCIRIQFPRKVQKIILNGNICEGFGKLSYLQHLNLNIPYSLDFPKDTVARIIDELKHCQEITKLYINLESVESLSLIGLLNYLQQLENYSLILSKVFYFPSCSCQRNITTQKIQSIKFAEYYQELNQRWFGALLEGYKHFTYLQELTIYFNQQNNIGNEGAILLSSYLHFFQNLKYLKIFFSMKSGLLDEGMIKIAKNLKSLKNLKELELEVFKGNQIGQETIQILFQYLSEQSQLQYLTFGIHSMNQAFKYDQILIEKKMCCLSSLAQLKSLKLSIYNEEIDHKGSIVLQNWISSLEQLQHLEFQSKEFRIEQFNEQDILNYNNLIKGIQQLTNLKSIYFKNLNVYQIEVAFSQIQEDKQLFPNLVELKFDHFCTNLIFEKLSNFLFKLPHLQILNINIQMDYRKKLMTSNDTSLIQASFPYLQKLREMVFIFHGKIQDNPKTIIQFAQSFSLIKRLNCLIFRNTNNQMNQNFLFHSIVKRKCKRLVKTSEY